MIYITVVAQLDGGPRECHNQMNRPINGSNRKSTTPYSIPEQIHDVLITNSQTYSIIRLSMLCPSGVIIPDNKLALPNDCFVSMNFFSFRLLFCVIFEESLLKLCSSSSCRSISVSYTELSQVCYYFEHMQKCLV